MITEASQNFAAHVAVTPLPAGEQDRDLLFRLFTNDPDDFYMWRELHSRSQFTPEESLFASLLVESCSDYLCVDKNSKADTNRKEAKDWLFRDSSNEGLPGFEAVCDIFHLSPSTVRRYLQTAQAKQESGTPVDDSYRLRYGCRGA